MQENEESNEEISTSSTTLKLSEPRLNPDEKLYVKAYLTTLSHPEAHRLVKGVKHGKEVNMFSKSDAVKYHINKQMINKIASKGIDEDVILDLLLQEATRLGKGSSPTARVQALTLLGKHLGMFEEKEKEKDKVIFNIVNYSNEDTKAILNESSKQIIEDDSDNNISQLPSNVIIKNFK